jgi:hypothetical protein
LRAPRSVFRRAVVASLLFPLVLGVSTSPSEANAQPVLAWLHARIVPARHRVHLWEHRARARRERVRDLSVKLSREGVAAHGSRSRASAVRITSRDFARATARLKLALRKVSLARKPLRFYQHARSKIIAAMHGAGAPGLPGGPVNYERWAAAFLSSIGARPCSSDLQAMVAWETAESTGARYNPLATTHVMPGSYSSAHSSVQNYVSVSQGIAATRETLLRGPGYFNYSPIIEDLLSCAPAGATASAIRNSYWCRGCGGGSYVVNQLPAVVGGWSEHASRPIGSS